MKRRSLLLGALGAAGTAATGTAGLILGFAPPPLKDSIPLVLDPTLAGASPAGWMYRELNASVVADSAYALYREGSCMYATFGGILNQLGQEFGEPYQSFPVHMMKYGASGIGGYGTVCGSLNGAAAVVGLFVNEKSHRNAMIEDLFTWYESASFPMYKPGTDSEDIAQSTSDSVLCHASTTKWVQASGKRIDSEERKERCSRLSADVASRTVVMLNEYSRGTLTQERRVSDETAGCISCHGETGKMGAVKGKMSCTSCHDTSVGHHIFADAHYQNYEWLHPKED